MLVTDSEVEPTGRQLHDRAGEIRGDVTQLLLARVVQNRLNVVQHLRRDGVRAEDVERYATRNRGRHETGAIRSAAYEIPLRIVACGPERIGDLQRVVAAVRDLTRLVARPRAVHIPREIVVR